MLTKNKIPPELLTSYNEKKCGFFAGAGLSTGAGFPNWKQLLQLLIDKAEGGKYLQSDDAAACRALTNDPSKYLMIAQELKDAFGVELKTIIEETFGNEAIKPTNAHKLLVTLKKSNFIITTNYDQLIEIAFVNEGKFQTPYKYYEAHAIQRQLFKREFFLLKAHGDAKTAADQIVLTDKDYRRLLYQELGYRSALQSVFTMYSVIFLGCSLDDPELNLLLNYINAAFPEGGIPHYALMSTDNISEPQMRRWRKDYNMKIIPISSADNYKDIEVFLEILHEYD